MPHDIVPYRPRLAAVALRLRQRMTLAEVLLWQQIKGGQIDGCDFDRQRPIDGFVVDFYCKRLRLAVEVDGRSHDYKQDMDDARQRRLERLGVRFIRFWDRDVRMDMQSVLRRLRARVRELEPVPPVALQPRPPAPPKTP